MKKRIKVKKSKAKQINKILGGIKMNYENYFNNFITRKGFNRKMRKEIKREINQRGEIKCNTMCGDLKVFALYNGIASYFDYELGEWFNYSTLIADLGYNGIPGNEMQRDEKSLYSVSINNNRCNLYFYVNGDDIVEVEEKIWESGKIPESVVIH